MQYYKILVVKIWTTTLEYWARPEEIWRDVQGTHINRNTYCNAKAKINWTSYQYNSRPAFKTAIMISVTFYAFCSSWIGSSLV